MCVLGAVLTYILLSSVVVPSRCTLATRLRKHKNLKLLPEDCGVSFSDRIIGGEVAQLGQYPWLARLGYILPGCTNKTSYRCGGALINSKYVLTAAHCATDLPEIRCPITKEDVTFELTWVALGEYNTTTDPDCIEDVCAEPIQKIKVEEIIVHESYNNPDYANDISLLRLETSVDFNGWVSPICLPQGTQLSKLYEGLRLEVAGWGTTNVSKSSGSKVPMFVKVPTLQLAKCRTSFSVKLNLDSDNQMCVGGEENKDSCTGDSGGPLMLVESVGGPPKYYAIGLVSFGIKHCGKKDKPAVYTRTAGYMEWILDHMRK